MQLPLARRRFLHLTGAAAALALPAAALALSPAALAQTPVTLRVGYIPIIPMTQLFIMEGEGWTRQAGIDLKLTQFSSGPAMVQALASGSLDVVYVGIGPAMVARSRGIDIKVLASNIIDQVAFIGRGPFAETMAAAPSAADGFRQFFERAGRPAKIATLPQGSVPDTILRYYVRNVAKADPAHVEIVGVGEDQVQQLLLASAVEGASILEPVLTIVQERDPTARIIAPANVMLPRQPGAVLAVRETVIAEHRDAVAKLVELHVRATDFANTQHDRAAAPRLRLYRQGPRGPRGDRQGAPVAQHQPRRQSARDHGVHRTSSGFPADHGRPDQAGRSQPVVRPQLLRRPAESRMT